MTLERYVGWTTLLAVAGLLTIAEARAQQFPETGEEVTTTNHQPATQDQLNIPPGWFAEKNAATNGPLNEAYKSTENERSSTPDEASALFKPEPPQPLSLPKVSKLSPLDKAYLDVFSILREDNACSRFYGGPPAAEVLNKLTRQLKPRYLDRSVALRMTGQTSVAVNHTSGFAYRLFEKAEINLNGPFYKARVSLNETKAMTIGNFTGNTREARVAILLHELGHMIKTPGNDWVLPDDGNDPAVSNRNTFRVIAVCRDQIKGLGRISFAQELSSVQTQPDAKSVQWAEAPPPTH